MNGFTKYHLAISKNRFGAMKASGAFSAVQGFGGLNVVEIRPEYDIFSRLIRRVGEPWGWTQRPRYFKNNTDAIKALLKKKHTRLFLLRNGAENVGYCMTMAPRLDPAIAEQLGPQDLFKPRVIEIENFGFFPEHTGKKYGQFFLPEMLGTLLADHESVYLSTRSTNHDRVVPFYQGLGLEVMHQETCADDLISVAANTGKLSSAKHKRASW